MIHLTVALHQSATEVFAYSFEVEIQPFKHLPGEHLFSVFGYKDQMQVKVVNDMSFCS